MSYERAHLQRFEGYTPGEQSSDPQMIKLNANECPYPPTEAVARVLREFPLERLARYPDPTNTRFRELAAAHHGLSPEHFVCTNAGDELLRLVINTFVDPGQPIGGTYPAFTYYRTLASVHGCEFITADLNEDWSLPKDYATQMNDAGAPLAFLINPHAPTGLLRSVETVRAFIEAFNGVTVLDEAYINFVDPELNYDAVPLVKEYDKLLILRTYSKGYALAGMRIGYGIGDPSLITPVRTKTRDLYNTDTLAQSIAQAAIQSTDQMSKVWDIIRAERQRVTQALSEMGFSVLPSQSNFILVQIPDDFHGGAKALYESLKDQKIYVRYFDKERLRNRLRITIGTPEENSALLTALKVISHA